MIVRSEGDRIVAFAPAKLNLFLEVRQKRIDGYHEIETLVVETDLTDRLTFQPGPAGGTSLECDDPSLSCGPGNLVLRAAERLRHEVGGDHGATIHLEKRIPMQAGLGGGSSDAAATLAGLNRLWDLGFPDAHLAQLGAELGSDVPFFFHGPVAICRGRGEAVSPVPLNGGPWHFVLVSPSMGVATVDVFRLVRVPEEPRSVDGCAAALRTGDPTRLGETLFNRLQPVSESLVPDLTTVRDALLSLDPPLDGSLMSGSGSTYFGLCRNGDAARAAARSLEALGVGRIRVVTCGP
jgi:4-diphosphocytidyl-2-C-methyl-D-erythritol kinase